MIIRAMIIGIVLVVITYTNSICQSQNLVRIKLDSTFDYRVMESITLSFNNINKTTNTYNVKSWSYDSTEKSTTFFWDSLISGKYVFRFLTKFKKSQIFKFDLSSDTSFNLTSELRYNNPVIITKKNLLKADTITIVYSNRGCFHDYFEESILIKTTKKNLYLLNKKTFSFEFMHDSTNSYKSKMISGKIINELFKLQKQSNKRIQKALNSKMHYHCTTNQEFALLANNNYYILNDYNIKNWRLYNKIMK